MLEARPEFSAQLCLLLRFLFCLGTSGLPGLTLFLLLLQKLGHLLMPFPCSRIHTGRSGLHRDFTWCRLGRGTVPEMGLAVGIDPFVDAGVS